MATTLTIAIIANYGTNVSRLLKQHVINFPRAYNSLPFSAFKAMRNILIAV